MSASLVGSEMCIRDSPSRSMRSSTAPGRWPARHCSERYHSLLRRRRLGLAADLLPPALGGLRAGG
eukprot:3143427-Alexandrium_andersonii.AAC.1